MMDNFTWRLTGDPDLDVAIGHIMCRVHPLEGQFPVGAMVRVIKPLPQIIARIHAQGSNYSDSVHIARDMSDGPCQVIGIQDLVDDDGVTRPYVMIQCGLGYMWPFRTDEIEAIYPR